MKDKFEFPCCPVCGAVLYEELFFDIDEHIVGCSECISSKDAAEYLEEQQEEAKQAYEDMLYEIWRDRQCGF